MKLALKKNRQRYAPKILNWQHLRHAFLSALTGRQVFFVRLPELLRAGVALVAAVVVISARAAPDASSDTNLIPAHTPLWTESMLWDKQLTVSSGFGYKDNVLLSSFAPRGSQFFINGLDLMLLRLPLDGWQVVGSVIGEDIHYTQQVGTNSADLFVASLRVQREMPAGWKAGLEVRGTYEKEVLDISTSQGNPATALVDGYAYTLQPSLRKDFDRGSWLQLQIPVTHWFFQAPLDEYWEYGPVVTAGQDFGEAAEMALSYGLEEQPHEEWVALDAYGRRLKSPLKIEQQRLELAWRQYWDSAHNWRSSSRLVFAPRRDNGGGYFNCYQYQAAQDLSFQTTNWLVKASVQLVYEIYPVQGVGILNGEILGRDLVTLSFEGERRLYRGLKVYGKWDYEQVHSKEAGGAGDYVARTVSFGLRYEF